MDGNSPQQAPPVDGRSLRWEQHKRERRAAIIQAAIEVTEENPPGTDIHVHVIARRAGIGRPAVYRHFEDRVDLDRAVQKRALEMLYQAVASPDVFDGSLREVIDRAIERYVEWAHEHRALHRLAVRELPGRIDNPLRNAIRGMSVGMRPVLLGGAEVIGATLDEDDEATVDLMVFGTASQIVSAVRLWLTRGDDRTPAPAALATRLAELLWHQLDGMARNRGATLDPDLPFSEILKRLDGGAFETGAAGNAPKN
jgi:AcrR family transcriptional regulator